MLAHFILGTIFAFVLTIWPSLGSPEAERQCSCHRVRLSSLFFELLATGGVYTIALLCTGLLTGNALAAFLGYAAVRSIRVGYLVLKTR